MGIMVFSSLPTQMYFTCLVPALSRWRIQKCPRHGPRSHPQQERRGDGDIPANTQDPKRAQTQQPSSLWEHEHWRPTLAGKGPETRQQGEQQELAWPRAGEEALGRGREVRALGHGLGALGRWVGQ